MKTDIMINNLLQELIHRIQIIVFNLNFQNIGSLVKSTLDLFYKKYWYSFNLIICRSIYSSFISQKKETDLYFSFLYIIETEEYSKFNVKIIPIFIQYILSLNSQESNFLISKLIENNLIEPDCFGYIQNKRTFYFSHLQKRINLRNFYYPFRFQFFSNFIELSNNNWKLHRKLVSEGINPAEVAKAIRSDNIVSLQQISTYHNFDFNQKIVPSLYERFSFINHNNVSLIDYAAFFGSINCFKFLLLNGSDIKNTGIYAIAGGNLEIFHICEKKNSLTYKSYEISIIFHQNNIFYYLYQNKVHRPKNLSHLGIQCIKSDNYEIFSFLEKEGMIITLDIINKAARAGNLFLLGRFNHKFHTPINPLSPAAKSGNPELFKMLLDQNNLDVNEEYVFFFYLVFIHIMLCLFLIFCGFYIFLLKHHFYAHRNMAT